MIVSSYHLITNQLRIEEAEAINATSFALDGPTGICPTLIPNLVVRRQRQLFFYAPKWLGV